MYILKIDDKKNSHDKKNLKIGTPRNSAEWIKSGLAKFYPTLFNLFFIGKISNDKNLKFKN